MTLEFIQTLTQMSSIIFFKGKERSAPKADSQAAIYERFLL
jgi:hypothetical protein